MELLVAIPAFDEVGTVGAIVTAARAHAPVLVVDDGSTDGTADHARAAGATVVAHGRRRGKGAALATAITAARAGGAVRVVTLDADGQHDPRDIPALLAASRTAPRAIVVGTRLSGDDDTLPRGRALAIRLAGFWVNWITGARVADTQSGFRVYPVALFDDVRLRGGRFVFETAILVEAARRGWHVCEVPIRVVPYASRASRFHPLADGVAIAAYLIAGALARWGVEIGAGAREVFRVFSRERRAARHGRMLARASAHAGGPSWGAALAVATAEEMQGGVTGWWHHPRARRARRAALATLAAPGLLVVALLAALTGGALSGVVEAVVRTLYDQRALPGLADGASVRPAEDEQAWVAAPR